LSAANELSLQSIIPSIPNPERLGYHTVDSSGTKQPVVKNLINKLLLAFCFAALLSSTGQSQSAPYGVDLPRFSRVSERLYRGAQPSDEGFLKLKELGIKTVINLRADDALALVEKAKVEGLGLRYYNVALPGMSAPTDEQVARVISIIDEPESGPIFIHCRRGSDRTGTIVALYRISHEGWTIEQALMEAKHHGLSWVEFGMKRYIGGWQERRSKPRAIAAPGGR